MKRTATVVLGAVVLVLLVAGGAVWATGGLGDDEATKAGRCGQASYELSAERDEQGVEVSLEVQSAQPGEQWSVSLLQDRDSLIRGDRTTDTDAELDADTLVPGAEGGTFSARMTPQGGETCIARVTL